MNGNRMRWRRQPIFKRHACWTHILFSMRKICGWERERLCASVADTSQNISNFWLYFFSIFFLFFSRRLAVATVFLGGQIGLVSSAKFSVSFTFCRYSFWSSPKRPISKYEEMNQWWCFMLLFLTSTHTASVALILWHRFHFILTVDQIYKTVGEKIRKNRFSALIDMIWGERKYSPNWVYSVRFYYMEKYQLTENYF